MRDASRLLAGNPATPWVGAPRHASLEQSTCVTRTEKCATGQVKVCGIRVCAAIHGTERVRHPNG
eukprot:1985377-Prymnesium_polylepis.1